MKTARLYTVSGMVQGVSYRYFTQKIANKIGVYGYVKNLYNGDVEVYAIGTSDQLQSLKDYLTQGPSFSRVDNVIVKDSKVLENYKSFHITF